MRNFQDFFRMQGIPELYLFPNNLKKRKIRWWNTSLENVWEKKCGNPLKITFSTLVWKISQDFVLFDFLRTLFFFFCATSLNPSFVFPNVGKFPREFWMGHRFWLGKIFLIVFLAWQNFSLIILSKRTSKPTKNDKTVFDCFWASLLSYTKQWYRGDVFKDPPLPKDPPLKFPHLS